MLTAYVKPTNYCNVGCEHCYLSTDVRAEKGTMSDEIFKATVGMLASMSSSDVDGHVHIVWHGGEPMTLSPEFYIRQYECINNSLNSFSESMQTSLIPYKSSFAQLVHDRFEGFLGSSIDFSSRKIKGSNSTYRTLWLEKLAHARGDGITIIPGVVPSKQELGKEEEMLDWFASHKFEHVNIERYNSYGKIDLNRPSNLEFSEFLIRLIDAILCKLKKGQAVPVIGIVKAAVNGVLNGMPGDRWGTTCVHDFIVVEPDGSTNNCPDKTSYDKCYSNVTEGVTGFVNSEGRRSSIRVHSFNHSNLFCSKCEFNSWCKTGCPIASNNEKECSGYKTFLLHLNQLLDDKANYELLIAYCQLFARPCAISVMQ